jgi:hypothetical protein
MTAQTREYFAWWQLFGTWVSNQGSDHELRTNSLYLAAPKSFVFDLHLTRLTEAHPSVTFCNAFRKPVCIRFDALDDCDQQTLLY